MTQNSDINNIELEEQNDFNLREVLHRYLSNWIWFLFSLFIAGVLAFVFIKLTTPLYQIETDLLIKDNKGTLGGQDDLLKDLDLFSSDKIIDNEMQILKSYTILEKVAAALHLETSYYSTGGVRNRAVYGNLPYKVQLIKPSKTIDYSAIYTMQIININQIEINGKTYPVNKPFNFEAGTAIVTATQFDPADAHNSMDVVFNDLPNVVESLNNKITITPVSKQGTVLIITLQEAVPQRGKDILDRLVYEYNNAAIDDKKKVTSSTLVFIEGRLQKLQEELGTAEKKVENYKSGNRITDISSESQIFLQSVQSNDAELSKINIQLSVLKNVENYLTKARDEQAQVPSMLGIDDPTLLSLVTQIGEAQLKRNSLLQTVPVTNPIVTSITDQINSLKEAISLSVRNLRNSLTTIKQQLERKGSSYQSIISGVPAKERGLLDVMRQQEIKNNLFTYLLQKREESEISLASTAADSRTIDAARSTKRPVKPVKPLIFGVFLMLGFLIPAAIIYLHDLLNFKVLKRSDIEKVTKVPIIAEISHSDDSSPLLVATKNRSMVAEQLRALRTNLNFIIPGDKQKVILFTSSISGEGKSFISLNLGASLAMSGKKVVILELDLRKPKLSAGLEIDNTKGLSNYFIGDVEYKDIVKPIPQQENYYIIPSGPIPPNPAELLVNGKIGELITLLKADFDYLLLDAPPVGLVTDAQILAEYADATMFIVRHNYSVKSSIYSIENFYRTKKFVNINIVMNSIDASGGYGGYGYGYGYGYGGYYQEEDDSNNKSALKRLINRKK
jgi:tyrosine-protein kinase Etk/Wzc